ncbi:cell division protein SepF [Priestia filamentosa]|uniref:cell division protein SepF n=1 Tax=Priestia filamentosa TaxID=1402861 RepID=UPI00058949C8
MKKTFLSMLRPDFIEQQESERNEEQQMSMTTDTETERRNNLSLSSDYTTSSTMSFMNSNIFLDAGTNVLMAEPKDMEDAEVISQAIHANKAIIVMLDDLEEGMDLRILDFLKGVCYVYDIMPRQLKTENKFLIDPLFKRSNQSFR